MKYKVFSIQHFKIISLVLILNTFYLILNTPIAKADSSLSVSPPIINIEAIPPADVRTPLTIENTSPDPVSLKVIFKPFRAKEETGQIEYLGDKEPIPGADNAIFEKIQLVEDNEAISSFDLGPRQKKKFEVRVIVPEKEPFSDYYFSIIFLNSPAVTPGNPLDIDKSNTSKAAGGIAANVLLSIGPKDQPKGYIEEFSAPGFVESGPLPFTLRVKNAGSHFITPRGVIIIKNMYGQAVGRVDLPQTSILSGTVRSLSNIKENDDPKIVWPEKFLLGYYTATLTLAVSDTGPLYTRSIHFMAFPAMLLLGLILALIIVVTIAFRVRKRMR